MATPQPPDSAAPGAEAGPAPGPGWSRDTHYPLLDYDDEALRVLRVRVAPWDIVCTVALLVLLAVLATATTWPTRLFGFLANVCEDETCGPVPYGLDLYIHPVVWGGIGAAMTAAVIGPVVSLLKGWYMSFWPVLSLALVMVSSIAGSLLTMFSERYWL
ncbi:hypothetical protein A5753_00375 [Mycobacterium sp. 852002-51971_SCH5477799-a]|uniref:hypothetical protein n=1 Tax=Mycobacterium sp. 852002-51971_SCH5477799-a TaxID=1834106 RepID=UPI0007FDF807|nr:hypothetical protein [Mycobacterium sp. 852002-51971_SCH5477799-a]OBF65792.1 hypothetical protein A5753_00375 [Mycobacterium sp. 852002-51971_SCH5477799-a]